MTAKLFTFVVVELCAGGRAEISAEATTLDGAFQAAAKTLPPAFGTQGSGLRLFRFWFTNGRTAETACFIGQGKTVSEAWGDGLKGTRDTFRPKNDGKTREANGVTVLVAPRPGDQALGRAVSRGIENFQGDETYLQERARRRREMEAQRLAAGGRAA